MTGWSFLQTALAALLLLAGVVDDLRSRKVHNQIVIAGLVTGLVFMIATQGLHGFLVAGLSFCTALVAVMPLYFMRILGGGDVKLLLAASILLGWKAVLITLAGCSQR